VRLFIKVSVKEKADKKHNMGVEQISQIEKVNYAR